jgi:PKD repeat protein
MQGQTLTFTARPGDAALRTAVLNYGDGSPALELGSLAAAATTSHEYARLGSYTARLDATSVSGETMSATVPIKVDTLVTASIETANFGNLNVQAVATVTGAPVLRYEWSFEPFLPRVVTTEPRAVFTYPTPGYKAVELHAVLVDGRVILASAAVIVGREHEG